MLVLLINFVSSYTFLYPNKILVQFPSTKPHGYIPENGYVAWYSSP